MGRQRRRNEHDSETERLPPAPPTGANRLLGVGVAFLAVGFVAGYLVGSDGSHGAPPPVAAPFANSNAPFAAAGQPAMASSAGLAPAVVPPPHKGHTFTGDVQVPPHSEDAHQLADTLVANVTCPCGGCEKMKIGVCQCDTAKEVAGFAAHLLERGKRGDEVLTQLTPRYGLVLDEAVLAQARTLALADPQLLEEGAPHVHSAEAAPGPAGPGSSAFDGLSGLSEIANSKKPVQRLLDVPTSARPTR